MSTAQQKILTFMNTLDTNSIGGRSALDAAVTACSSFSSAQDWIDHFISDIQSYLNAGHNAAETLSALCGINLTNADTGSITGLDAGNGIEKTALSIISESTTSAYPSSSTSNINGLTVTWPTASNLSSSEKQIIRSLNSWWLPNSLNLINESYGMNFNETGTSVKTLSISFYNENSSTLANTSFYYDTNTGKSTSLNLSINMYYYSTIAANDPNGASSSTGVFYLDRVIAHELTHAVTAANINYDASLPNFITEGLADLVQGADDERKSEIYTLCSNPSVLAQYLNLNDTSTESAYVYAAGYMALRYLANYGTTPAFVPTSYAYYNSSQTTLTITNGISGDVWLDGRDGLTFASTVKEIDASASDGTMILAGNNSSNLIISGSGTSTLWGGDEGNDTLVGGNGSDHYYYANGEGENTIYNYQYSNDTIHFYSGNLNDASVSGNDIRLISDNTYLTIKSVAGGVLRINDDTNYQYRIWIGKNADNTIVYDTDLNFYYGSSSHTDTLKVTGSGDNQIWMNNTSATVYRNIDILDANSSTGSNLLAGSGETNTIIAGSGSSTLWGGVGETTSDTLQGGNGADAFYYGSNEGCDFIVNGSSIDKVMLYSDDFSYSSASLSGNDLIISTTTVNLTIKNWSESTLNTMELANHEQYKFIKTSSGITTQRIR